MFSPLIFKSPLAPCHPLKVKWDAVYIQDAQNSKVPLVAGCGGKELLQLRQDSLGSKFRCFLNNETLKHNV